MGSPEPSVEWKTVYIFRLCCFFTNPARFLLTQRLGIVVRKRKRFLMKPNRLR